MAVEGAGKPATEKLSLTSVAANTALRDITDRLARGILRKSDARGRSTSDRLNDASTQD